MTDWITAIEPQYDHGSIFTEERFRNVFKYEEPERRSVRQILQQKLKCSKDFIFNLLPILEWLPKYSFKNEFLGDVLIAVVMTPMLVQLEVAYADIAGLPLVTGLYASIFPTIIYFFMGSSRNIAIGLSGFTSLMIGKSVANYANNHDFADQEYTPLQISTAITFLSGIWLLIFSIFRLGFVSSFLSDSFTAGFYLSGVFHILPGRMKTLLGIHYPEPQSMFSVFYDCYELFRRIADINYVTFGMSAFVLITLPIFNKYVSPMITKRFPNSKLLSIFDLLLIILMTILAYVLDLHNRYDLDIVGDIPEGLPEIVIPPFEIFPKLLIDSLVLSIIVIPLYLPLTKMLAKKHKYKINDNQELLAYGVINTVTSLFSCPLTGNSLARSIMQDSFGGGSQITNLVTSTIILLVLLFISPIIKHVPICVLSSIIIIRMVSRFKDLVNIGEIYRKSKLDGAVCTITAIASIIVDLNYGTIVGMIASAIASFIPSHRTKVIVLGCVPGTEIFLDKKYFKSAVPSEHTLILKIIGNIHFANSENVQEKILQVVPNSARFVILNLACVGYIDPTGVKSLLLLSEEFKKLENKPLLFVTDCLPGVYKKLADCDFFETIPKNHVFASVKDAVESSSQKQELVLVYETITKF